jgi:hypothetical protein
MIIYNVTLAVSPEIEEEFIQWLNEIHIPEVLETELFIKAELFKIIEDISTKAHNSYAVQYRLENWKHFEEYQAKHATALKQKTIDKYGEKVLAYRTFLEKF